VVSTFEVKVTNDHQYKTLSGLKLDSAKYRALTEPIYHEVEYTALPPSFDTRGIPTFNHVWKDELTGKRRECQWTASYREISDEELLVNLYYENKVQITRNGFIAHPATSYVIATGAVALAITCGGVVYYVNKLS
jgi:hypothetical protein